MPIVAEAVPCFLHVSLFLFFAGLCKSLLNINRMVGISTTVPIAISSLMYILATFIPVIFPQLPYQNPFSIVFWYLKQNLPVGSWRYQDRGSDGARRSMSWKWNMAQERMELAMEETEKCKG
jgi:hypothetical protein